MSTSTIDDRLAITDLASRHGRWLDGGEGRAGDFFTEDVEVVSPRGRMSGLAEVAGFLDRARQEHSHHRLTDVLVNIDGDHGELTANQVVDFFEPGQPPYRSAGLRITYGVVRTPAGWRIRRSYIELVWVIGELPGAPAAA
jgi:hypothetical protein